MFHMLSYVLHMAETTISDNVQLSVWQGLSSHKRCNPGSLLQSQPSAGSSRGIWYVHGSFRENAFLGMKSEILSLTVGIQRGLVKQ